MIRFPKPLRAGDRIAITAPSSGVSGPDLARLDLVLSHLRGQGFDVVEGGCLRAQYKDASAPRDKRATELSRFLLDPTVAAIFPPWGGELASELLESIDFEALRSVEPKWLLGYSDLTTLQLPLTLISGWATAHGSNLMDLAPSQTDPLTSSVLTVLAADLTQPVTQRSSTLFQRTWVDYAKSVATPLNLTEQVEWKRLDASKEPIAFEGRIVGGCLDTIAWLAGSKYGDVPKFIRESDAVGTILYFENAEMGPPALVRALLSLRRQHWFNGLAGLLIGRSAGPVPESADSLSYTGALRSVLGDLPFPVVFDVDIGHQPPQFTIINGSVAKVECENGRGSLVQSKSRH